MTKKKKTPLNGRVAKKHADHLQINKRNLAAFRIILRSTQGDGELSFAKQEAKPALKLKLKLKHSPQSDQLCIQGITITLCSLTNRKHFSKSDDCDSEYLSMRLKYRVAYCLHEIFKNRIECGIVEISGRNPSPSLVFEIKSLTKLSQLANIVLAASTFLDITSTAVFRSCVSAGQSVLAAHMSRSVGQLVRTKKR